MQQAPHKSETLSRASVVQGFVKTQVDLVISKTHYIFIGGWLFYSTFLFYDRHLYIQIWTYSIKLGIFSVS